MCMQFFAFARGLCICAYDRLVQTRALLSCCLCEYFLGFWESFFVVFSRRFFLRTIDVDVPINLSGTIIWHTFGALGLRLVLAT